MKKFLRVIVLFAVLSLIVSGALFAGDEKHGKQAAGHKSHWAYEGSEGPEKWGDLSGEYAVCKTGKGQSPVNIPAKAEGGSAMLAASYKATPVKVINNGHTIQLNYAPGSTLTIDGKNYELLQVHFHSPSEHALADKRFPMEAHLVHKNAEGKLAVIGVFMEEGKENPFIKTLWDNIPAKVGEEKTAAGVTTDATALLPKNSPFYYYIGSLTTPPCSEGVSWNVMKNTVQVSKGQVDKFVSLLGKDARPLQPLNDRKIMESAGKK